MPSTITFDTVAALAKRKGLLGKSQAALDLQIIKDSNVFCPQAEGTLQASAITASQVGKGLVLWATPYARRLYRNPQFNFSKDKNPHARGLWFEAAKALHAKDWLILANREAGGA